MKRGILGALALAAFCAVLSGCTEDGRLRFIVEREYKACIQESVAIGAQAVSANAAATASRLRGIDTQKCPPEFQTAVRNHIAAWDEAASLQAEGEKIKSSVGSAMACSLFLGDVCTRSLQTRAKSLDADMARVTRRLEDTRDEVEIIAGRHGVYVELPRQVQGTR